MSMVPLETENTCSPNSLGLVRRQESIWLTLTIILAVLIGLIALFSYAI